MAPGTDPGTIWREIIINKLHTRLTRQPASSLSPISTSSLSEIEVKEVILFENLLLTVWLYDLATFSLVYLGEKVALAPCLAPDLSFY